MDIKGIQKLGIDGNEYCYLLFLNQKNYNWPGWSINMGKLVDLGYIDDSSGELTKKGKFLFKEDSIDEDFLVQYRELFPKKKLPSGSYARVDIKDLRQAFKKFFKNYSYSKDTVLQATKNYINEYSNKDFMYMKNSYFFIDKKGEPSTLAAYCESAWEDSAKDQDEPTYLGGSII